MKEGFNLGNEILKPIKKFFTKSIADPIVKFVDDSIIKPIDTFFEEEIIDPIEGLIKEIEKELSAFFKEIGAFFEMLGEFFASIPTRLNLLVYAIGSIFEGVGNQFYAIGEGIAWGFEDIGLLIYFSTEWIGTYFACGYKYLSNIVDCIFYYIMDMIFFVLYLPITILLYALFSMNFDLYSYEKQAWQGVETIDTILYELTGVHIIYWPKSIREKCYVCIRLKTDVLSNKAHDIDVDFSERLPNHVKNATKKDFDIAAKRFNEIGAARPRDPSFFSK
tara:strand:+ start:5535 stop:6365 length:831 start_codon:yes stop_codon:yes gene_type:complete